MSDIPPKQPVSGTATARMQAAAGLPPLPHDDQPPDIDATTALVSLHDAATQSGPDSFPVLKAFQDYLESERRRARQRIVLVTSLFVAIIVVLMSVLLGAGALVFNFMRENQTKLWQRLETQPVAAPVAVAAAPAGDERQEALAATLQQMSLALTELQQDNLRLRQELARPAPAPAAPAATVAASATPATPPQKQVAAAAPPPAVAAAPVTEAVAQTAPETVPSGSRATATAAAATPIMRPRLELPPAGATPPAPPDGYRDGNLYFQAKGFDVPVAWRVLVPTAAE